MTTPPSNAQLEERIVEALDAFEEGGAAALEVFYERHPDVSGAVRKALSSLAIHGLTEDSSAESHDGDLSESSRPGAHHRLGAYEIQRPLGGGGMGVVYLALDTELAREVALKLVRPDLLHFTGARERFRREILAVAKLQHPGIVPLYGVGEEDGVPYYSMEYVPGRTLAELLERLADRPVETLSGADLWIELCGGTAPSDESPERDTPGTNAGGPPPLFQGSWEATCLRIVREIAEALEYAHRRGVVHRDVKPSNVLLTREGRVLLFDFGLSSQRGAARITKSGTPLGSLAYMAPEMLEGVANEDDPRLDVYALGVTLFELLTLRLPFDASSELALRASVARGRFPAARRYHTRLSWESETICLVASDAEPKRRYTTAGAFARDCSNALASRPLEARPPGRLLRMRRWTQRHPLGAAAILAAAFGPSLFAYQEWQNGRVLLAKTRQIEAQNMRIEEQNETLELALDEAKASRLEAEESFDKALEAVDRMLARVGDETLVEVPHMFSVRADLLQDALEFYEWFLERGEDGLARENARIAERAAALHLGLGNGAEASALFQASEELLVGLDPSEDPDLFYDRLQSRLMYARSERVRGALAESEEVLGELKLSLDQLPDSESMRFYRLWGFYLREMGHVLRDKGELAASAERFEESAVFFEAGVEGSGPWHVIMLRGVIESYQERGSVLVMLGRSTEEVLESWDLGLDAAQRLLDLRPGDPEARYSLARGAYGRASTFVFAERNDEAVEGCRDAYEMLEPLAREFPSVHRFQELTALASGTLCGLLVARGELDEAERMGRVSMEHLEGLDARTAGEPQLLGALGVTLVNWTRLQAERGDREALLASLDDALQCFRQSMEFGHGNPYFADTLRTGFERTVSAALRLGLHGEAFERVLAFLARASGPADVHVAINRADGCLRCLDAFVEPGEERDLTAAFYAEYFGEELLARTSALGLDPSQLLSVAESSRLEAEPAFRELLERR